MEESSSMHNGAVQEIDATSKNVSSTLSFIWVIENIVDYPPENDLCSYSCEIKMDSSKSNWCFTLTAGSCMALTTRLVQRAGDMIASVSVGLLDVEFNKKYNITGTKLFHSSMCNHLQFSSFLKEEELRDNKETLLHDNDLILYGEITVLSNEIERRIGMAPVVSCFSRDMSELLKQGIHSDLKIIVKGKEFNCHRAMLVSRSQFFDALLKKKKNKKCASSLVFEDIEPDVFQLVLKYIYTNELDITLANMMPILAAAHKYQLNELKRSCEEQLQKFFSFCNLSEILAIAETFSLHNLKCRALKSWAMFTKQCNKKQAMLPEQEDESVGESQNCEGSSQNKAVGKLGFSNITHKISDLAQRLCRQNVFLPTANVWICTKKYVALNDKWIIRGFSDHIKCKDVPMLYSFINGGLGVSCEVKIIITREYFPFPNDPSHSYSGYVMKLCFTLVSSRESQVSMKFCFSLEDVSGAEFGPETSIKIMRPGDTIEVLSIPKIDEQADKNLLHDGDLRINCRCWVLNYSIHYQEYPVAKNCLTTDVSSLLTNFKCSDIVIKVRGTSFPCHKPIIASRSAFLAQMIEEHCNDGVVELDDVEPELFKNILFYIYSDEYESVKEVAWVLLPLAVFYKLEHLKHICENVLVSKLSLENALETLKYAITHSAHSLQIHTLKYIKQHFISILAVPRSFDQIDEYGLTSIITHALP